MVPRQVGLRFSGTALTYALAAAGYLAVATVARGQAVARQEVTGGLAAGGRVVQTTSSHDATTTGLPAGARLVAGLDTSGGSARLVTSVVDPQAERVLIQLRGVPLARARALGQRASAPALAAQRQRASATIVQLAAQGRGRALTRADVITREYEQVFHGFAARLPAGTAAQVRQLPDVEAVYPDLEAHASLSDSVPLIQAPAFWSAYGYRGAGTVIAIIDTGVDYTHADLGGCFGPSCKVIGGYDFANNDADPVDDNGHGTHVTSIAGGNGTFLGVAPDASILAYKVLNQYGSGFYSDIIAGIERAVDPNNDSDSSDHADVINMSLGGPGDPDDALSQAVDNASAAGVLVAVAAGNNGDFFTVGSPGVARTAVTVGATDKQDQLASFSSRGPSANIFGLKPEIVAPGVDICAARANGTQLGATCTDSSHIALSGTSMATPHVAGAAALLRGLYPALSPADIKSLLVQNSVDLGYEALVQGAGRLDVLAAAEAHSVVAPAAVSFGLDDLSVPSWTPGTTLTVRNIDTSPRAYTLNTTPLLAGIAVTFTPSSFTLAAGDSIAVTMQLSVDNTTVPNISFAPYAYDDSSVLIASGSEQQRLPFTFLKSPLLRLHFDQQPGIVVVHDRSARSWAQGAQSTTVDFLVPDGTYDVIAQLGDGSVVVREGVAVSGRTELTINHTEAGFHLTLGIHDETDTPLPSRLGGFTLTHRASDISPFVTLGGVFDVAISAVSDAYDIDMMGEALAGIKEYVVLGGFRDGVSGDRQLGNQALDLTAAEVRYYPRPPETSISFINYLSWMFVGPYYSIGFSFGDVDPWPGFVEKQFLTAPPFQPYRFFAQKVVEDQPPTHLLHESGYLRGGTTPGTVEALDFTSTQPVYTTGTGELPLNLGPAWWSKHFSNWTDGVTFNWVNNVCIAFRGQGGDGPEVPSGTVPWALKSGSTVVASGDMPQSSVGCPYVPPQYPPVSVIPGPYEFDAGPMPYFVGGVAGSTTVTASFDTSLSDPNPPWMSGLSLRTSGRLTDVAEAGTPVVLDFTLQDESLASVAVTYDNGQGPVALTPVAGGPGQFEVTIPGCQPGGVAVSITATDSAGNQVRQDFTPAFNCVPPVCGDGVIGAAEGCDDGNTTNGDGCSESCQIEPGWACTGAPSLCATVCGDGLTVGREQCDDGNRVNGDGCAANCTYELIPGDGNGSESRDRRACRLEWSVANPTNAPQLDEGGRPHFVQTCRNNDPRCDFGTDPDACEFRVVACLNNVDPKLPRCPAVGVRDPVRVVMPGAARDPANHASLMNALATLRDSATGATAVPLPLGPAQTGVCTAPFPIRVPLGHAGTKALPHRVKLLTVTQAAAGGLMDVDRLTLVCVP